MEIKRYNFETWESDSGLTSGHDMELHPNGNYVLYDDVVSLLTTKLERYDICYWESESFYWKNGYCMDRTATGKYALYRDFVLATTVGD
jgi:hypothetical protein